MPYAEACVYSEVEDYIATTYNNAAEDERSAVGFGMTIYRKRLASSFFALRRTLEERLRLLEQGSMLVLDAMRVSEDAVDDVDETGDEANEDLVAEQKRQTLRSEEKGDIRRFT